MALKGFLMVDGIEGKRTDNRYPGWIETLSFSTRRQVWCKSDVQSNVTETGEQIS